MFLLFLTVFLRFLRDSGFTQVPLTSNSSVTPVVNRDFDHHSREVPRDSEINKNNSIFEDRQNYRKSSNISSASSSSLSSSCKRRNFSGAVNNRSFPFGSKRNQVKSSLCTNFHGITSKSLSSTSATTTPTSISSSSSLPGIMSSKASTLQSNITCSNVVDSSNRIPAPNVNAVNLSQVIYYYFNKRINYFRRVYLFYRFYIKKNFYKTLIIAQQMKIIHFVQTSP